MVLGLSERPKERVLRRMAEAWSPWRSVAANVLWVHYTRETAREGVA
jgi:DNA-3-methyladenine glycosylase II